MSPQEPIDYTAGNARKDRHKTDLPEKPKEEKIITGEVIVKKKSMVRRFKDTFIEMDPQTVARYVASEVLLPALKNMLYDAWVKGGGRMMFGENAMRRQTFGQQIGQAFLPRSHTTYQSMNPINRLPDPRFAPSIPIGPRSSGRTMSENIILSTKEDATIALERLNDIIDTYGFATVVDYHEVLGIGSEFTDAKFGWVSLVGVEVIQVREGFVIDLPAAQPID